MLDKIQEPIKSELAELENRFTSLIKSEIEIINRIFTYIVAAKGKRVRPMLLFLCSGLTGKPTEKSYEAALIVELLHTATLIHDDVVDNSDLRRGRPSVNSLWENKISVLIGDFLFAEVLNRLNKLNSPRMVEIVSSVTKQMSQGELLQMERAHDFQMNEDTYFQLISNKTASLIAATCQLGALTSQGADATHVENLRTFGESLGIAFQIKDDLLDFYGNEKDLGKPIGKDLLENIITLPVLYGLKKSNEKSRKEILAILQNGKDHSLDKIIHFARETGGIDYAEATAQHYIQIAQECMERYSDSPYKKSLTLLSDFITSREM
ncbi:MAG: polyprenyl synthetase family protein [Candidatus Zhuqueibacterota bacterium]